MAYQVVESHDSGTTSFQQVGDNLGNEYRLAQGFQLDEGYTVGQVSVYYTSKVGTPAGDITIRLETNNGSDLPSGDLVDVNATKAFTPFAVGWYDLEFPGTFALSSATPYWVVFQCDDQAANNRWLVRNTTDTAYADGRQATSSDGGDSWSLSDAQYDVFFKIWALVTDASANLVCQTTSLLYSSINAVSRVTVIASSSANLVSRITVPSIPASVSLVCRVVSLIPASASLLCRLTSLVVGTNNLVSRLTSRLISSLRLNCRITVPAIPASNGLPCRLVVWRWTAATAQTTSFTEVASQETAHTEVDEESSDWTEVGVPSYITP